jgi:hypothetical protein
VQGIRKEEDMIREKRNGEGREIEEDRTEDDWNT